KLFCYSFTSWDSKKEWSTELPVEEEVVGLAAGDGWLAASTDMNRVRIFTIGGAQKQIIEVGGPIITTSGHEDLLFITFHNGIGLRGNQCIAYSIYRIKPSLKPFPLVSCEPLPVSPKAQVAWIGFSDEGTPVCSDSKDMLRILSGRYWTPFCTMKEHLAGASDHFWVVGVSELMQRIRAVKCKGLAYPPTLPRPVLMQLDAQVKEQMFALTCNTSC
ncbi:WD repeat and HMG-box DNA-binding protein 1, partial [Orchesella cincta]